MSIKRMLVCKLKDKEAFSMQEAYDAVKDRKKHSVRARIYESLGINFKRLAKGVYKVINENTFIVEGDGRDLSFIPDESIECIITDHPWEDKKSLVGGARKFANSYDCFHYTQEDFYEKARVLKEGSFLVEIVPAENENNFEYLYKIKKMAEKAGFKYYSKVPWKKGSFIGNTGRKSKNTEDVMIFSKGKARKLRLDAKKSMKCGYPKFMSGTNGMLPTAFDYDPPKKKDRIHQAEKPVGLLAHILAHCTKEDDIVLDQFAGGGSTGEACMRMLRKCILIEIKHENIKKIVKRLRKCERELLFA